MKWVDHSTRKSTLIILVVSALVGLFSATDASAQNFNDSAVERVEDIENGAKRVVVKQGATWQINVGNNETVEDLLIDIDRPGANATIVAQGTGWTIRNVGFKGPIKDKRALRVGGENGTVDNVYLGDGSIDNSRVIGVFVNHRGTEGPLDFRRVHIARFANNGIYGSPTAEDLRGGVVNIYDSYFNSNNISNFKLGSPLDTCVVENTVVRTDDETSSKPDGTVNKRAMWALDNPDGGHPDRHRVLLKNVDIDGRIAAEPGAIVELEETRFSGEFIAGGDVHEDNGDPDGELIGQSEGDPDLSPPATVPTNAYEAATGDVADSRDDDRDDDDDPEPPQEEPVLSIEKRTDTVTLDGKLDEAAWEGVDEYLFDDPDQQSDNEVSVRALFDDESLYFGWQVDDDDLETNDDRPPHRSDSVEFFLDPLLDRGSEMQADDIHITVSFDERVRASDHNREEIIDAIGLGYAADTRDGGYSVEFKFDWDGIDAEPADDLEMGALFANNDLDDGGRELFSEPLTDVFAQPHAWSLVALSEADEGPRDEDDERDEDDSDDTASDAGSTGGDAGNYADSGDEVEASDDSQLRSEGGCSAAEGSPARGATGVVVFTAIAMVVLGRRRYS